MPVSVVVSSAKLSGDGQHTVFSITVKNDASNKTWMVDRRFSEFSALRDKLVAVESALPKLPGKSLLKVKSPDAVKERVAGLNQWLQDINRMERVNNHPAFLQFLDVEHATSTGKEEEIASSPNPSQSDGSEDGSRGSVHSVSGGGGSSAVVRIRLDPSLGLPSSHISLMSKNQTAAEWKNETVRKLNLKYKRQLDGNDCFLVDVNARPVADGAVLSPAELESLTIMQLDRLAQPPVKAGGLLKLAKTGAGSWRTWDKRHFVLTEGQLAYYTDATLCNLKGTVVLAKAQVVLPHLEKYGKEFAIEIRRADCDKMYVLVASNKTECREWFDCIKRETESTRKVILEGFLGRPDAVDTARGPTQRWVVLVPDALHYYKHKGDTKITGSINLSQGAKVTIDSKAKFSFAVCPNNSLKTFVLTAASEQEMNTWVNAIKKAILDQSTLDPVLESTQSRRHSSFASPWLRDEQRNPFTTATLSNLWNACDKDQDGSLSPEEIDEFLTAWAATNGSNLARLKSTFWTQFTPGQSLSKEEVLGNTRESMVVRQPRQHFAGGKPSTGGTLKKPISSGTAQLISELKREGGNNLELMTKFEAMCEDGAPDGFFTGGGLDALSAILGKVKYSRKGWQEAKGSDKDCDLPQLAALKALKAIVVSEAIMTLVISSLKLVDNIALCCLSKNPKVQMAALEMLTLLVTIHERGTECALAALANLKQIARTIKDRKSVV